MGGSTEEKTEDKPAAKASVPSKAEDKLFFDAVAKKTTKVSGLKQFWRRLITGDPNKRVRDKFFPTKGLNARRKPSRPYQYPDYCADWPFCRRWNRFGRRTFARKILMHLGTS